MIKNHLQFTRCFRGKSYLPFNILCFPLSSLVCFLNVSSVRETLRQSNRRKWGGGIDAIKRKCTDGTVISVHLKLFLILQCQVSFHGNKLINYRSISIEQRMACVPQWTAWAQFLQKIMVWSIMVSVTYTRQTLSYFYISFSKKRRQQKKQKGVFHININCMSMRMLYFLYFRILCLFEQEWWWGGSYREGGERHQGEEDSQLSEEQDDWLFQQR